MQLSLKYSFRPRLGTRSVTNSDEVVGQRRHGAKRLGRLDLSGVMYNEEGLLGLDDDETFLALFSISVFILACVYDEVHMYLLRLQCVPSRIDGHVLMAVDLNALQNHLFRIVRVCEGVEDDLEFSLGDLGFKSAHDRMPCLPRSCGIMFA